MFSGGEEWLCPEWAERRAKVFTNRIDELKAEARRIREERENLYFVQRIAKLLRDGVVVTPEGGFGWWPEGVGYFREKDGVLHFLTSEAASGGEEAGRPYAVPREYFQRFDQRQDRPLEAPVLPLAALRREACPRCGAVRPVMEWFQEIHGSPEGDACETIVFLICHGDLHVLRRWVKTC